MEQAANQGVGRSNGTICMSTVLSPGGSASGTCGGDRVENIRGSRIGISVMGKYFLGWILGVPVIVLVVIYLLFN